VQSYLPHENVYGKKQGGDKNAKHQPVDIPLTGATYKQNQDS
jgi:hypothetical protein